MELVRIPPAAKGHELATVLFRPPERERCGIPSELATDGVALTFVALYFRFGGIVMLPESVHSFILARDHT